MPMFAPSSAYNLGSLHQPEVYYSQSISPRDRYLTALAQARSAEAEYVAALIREQALQKQREAEQRQRAELQRQRIDAVHNQLLLDALFSQDATAPSPLADPYSVYTTYARQPVNLFGAQTAAIHPELNLRHAAVQRQRQEVQELAKQRYFALLHQEQEEERDRTQAVIRHLQQAKQREHRATINRYSDEAAVHRALGLLLGEYATARKAPSQEAAVPCPSTHLPCDPGFKVKPRAACPPSGCRRQADEDEDVSQIWKHLVNNTQPICASLLKEYKQKEARSSETKCQTPCEPSVAPAAPIPAPTASPFATPSSSGPFLKDRLEAHLHNEPQPEVRDGLQKLLSFLGANRERKEQAQRRREDAATTSAAAMSLKEHLEARLHNDPSVEIHDTLQAMLASLMTSRSTSTSDPSAKDVNPAYTSPSASASTTAKDKGKQVSFDLPTSITAPTSKDVVDSVNTIHNIEAAFKALSTDFSFPLRLDFSPSATPTAAASDSNSDLSAASPLSTTSEEELAYTSTNAPVRYYEQALSALLTQLDAVESWGNEEVRKERKELVGRVESALEEVEREVHVRLVQYRARNAASDGEEAEEGAGETVKVEEVSALETVQVGADTPAETTDGVPHAVEVLDAVDNVNEQQSLDGEGLVPTTVDANATSTSISTEDNVLVDSQDTIVPGNITSAEFDATPTIDQSLLIASGDSHNSTASADLLGAINSTEKEAEIQSVVHSSYPPLSQAFEPATLPESTTLSPVVRPEVVEQVDVATASESSPSSPQTATEDSEPVDTFLLPLESPISFKRPAAADEDELVVVDTEHGEASDGENWSEVEA